MINSKFYDTIEKKVLDAIFVEGYHKLVLWGFNEDCSLLFRRLSSLGLSSVIKAIIDSDEKKHGISIDDFIVSSPESILEKDLDCLVITRDKDKEHILKKFAALDKRIPRIIFAGIAHMEFADGDYYKIRESCIVKSYAGGYDCSLIHVYQCIKYLIANNVRGNIAEFGMFKGGTLLFIYKTFQFFQYDKDVNYYGFDTFDGFPEKKSVLDLYSQTSCEYKHYQDVMDTFGQKFKIIKGDIVQTHNVLQDVPLMFTFFDTDNYTPSNSALELCYKNTVPGGFIAFDHFITDEQYIDTIGERIAAVDFFESKNVFHLHNTGIFMKIT